jgi:hypothetical protein
MPLIMHSIGFNKYIFLNDFLFNDMTIKINNRKNEHQPNTRMLI